MGIRQPHADHCHDVADAPGGAPHPDPVLHGDHDLVPVEVARHIADAIPDARFVVLPDCGHFSFLEQRVAVHAAIAELLSEL